MQSNKKFIMLGLMSMMHNLSHTVYGSDRPAPKYYKKSELSSGQQKARAKAKRAKLAKRKNR